LKRKKLTRRLKIEAAKLAAMPDSEIDCSDIPEVTDWTGFERRDPYLGRIKISNADKVVPPIGERKRP